MNSPEIQAIRERYKASLPEKANLLIEQRNALIQSSAYAMDELHGSLHKLAGSSGMYGYDDIALLSRNAMISAQNKDSDVLTQQLSELIELLQKHDES